MAAAEQVVTPLVKARLALFVAAWENKTVPEFYQESCSPQLAQRIGKEAHLVMSLYESFQTAASNLSLQVEDPGRVVVTFACLTTGVRLRDGKREVIFEGSFVWELRPLGSQWQIVRIDARGIDGNRNAKEEK